MSKTSRKTRASSARPGTIAADPHIRIEDKPVKSMTMKGETPPFEIVHLVDVFTEDELRTAPLRIVNASTARARVWRSASGAEWYRNGFYVRIRTNNEGVLHFQVVIHKGANRGDLDHALRIVDRARNGNSTDGWTLVPDTGYGIFYTAAFTSREYGDPYVNRDYGLRVTACTAPKCREKWHEEDSMHVLDSVSRDLRHGVGSYEIEVRKPTEEPGADWTVDVRMDEFFGAPEDVTTFVNDLQWMQEEARRANQPETTACETAKVA